MEDISKDTGDGDLESTNVEDISKDTGDGDLDSTSMEDILKSSRDGDLEWLEEVEAKKKGAIAAARDTERRTALHLAASEGHTEVCQYLIAKLGLPVDPRDIYGETPLYIATGHGHVDTVRCLLINKANPHVKSSCGVTALHEAAILGNSKLLEILIEAGVKLNSLSYKESPLACAIRSGSFHCFKALIKAGAAPAVIMYPLHAAAKSGSVEIVNWFLEAKRDPNACNNDGKKPIQVAAFYNNLEVVELLLPRTTQFLDNTNWTVLGLLENERKAKEVALQRSQFVQIGRDEISDKEIEEKLGEMLLPNEDNFFEHWSPLKKRLFFESTFVIPSSLKQISDNGIVEIKNSVIFDLTNKNRVQPSYVRAINAYRAWHFSGTDLTYEIGPHRKRFCASRKDQTFIFWFRYLNQDVGLVIDGQTLWAEGMMRRTRGEDGRFKYSSPIQFRNARKEDGSSSSSSKQKPVVEPPYIVHSELIEADYGGNYAGKVSNFKYSVDTTRSSVIAVSKHDKKKSLKRDCHDACDNLVFLGTEAGKNLWISEYSMHCLDPKLKMPLAVPQCFNGTVNNHQQVSKNVLLALESAARMKLQDLPGGGYKIVNGAPFRTLWQCLNAYVILRRHRTFKTKFFLKGKEQEYRSQVQVRPERQPHETDKEFEERVHKENVRTGTLFDPKLHGGLRHRLPVCPKPLKPSRKRWYHVDEPYYEYEA